MNKLETEMTDSLQHENIRNKMWLNISLKCNIGWCVSRRIFLNKSKSKIHLVPPNSQVGTFLNMMTGVGWLRGRNLSSLTNKFKKKKKKKKTLKATENKKAKYNHW